MQKNTIFGFRETSGKYIEKGRSKMAENYYQQEFETMSREDMKKLQSEKLVKQVKHVYENVAYYRNLIERIAQSSLWISSE